jgi:hypothetical protein
VISFEIHRQRSILTISVFMRLPTGMFMSLIWSGRILVDALLPLLLYISKYPQPVLCHIEHFRVFRQISRNE